MPAVRRLVVTLITVLVILGRGAASWAAIEVSGGPSCCCPDPTRCECFDHDGGHHEAPQMKRCAQEPLQAAMPLVAPAILPPPPPTLIAPSSTPAPTAVPARLPERDADRPEKPPS